MATYGDRTAPREGQDADCYEKHRDWTMEQWDNEMLPKVKNLIYVTLGGMAVMAVLFMVAVAKSQVAFSGHATKAEVKEVKVELKDEIQLLKEEIQHDLDKLNQLHQEGFDRMEDKMDENFKEFMSTLLEHDRDPSP